MWQTMPSKLYSRPMVLLLGFLFGYTCLGLSAIFQSADSDGPKLKDFGSSLKRIKWDPKLNASVEIESVEGKVKSEKSTSDAAMIRVETALVAADYLVVDKGGMPVLGLQQNDFVLTEDNLPQQVGMFSPGDSGPIRRSIVLIIDYSGSLFNYIDTSVEAAKGLVDQLGPRDKMAIVTDAMELLADFTRDKTELKSKLDSLKLKAQDDAARRGWGAGHSLQLSALFAILKEAFDAEDERPIVIFQTDGDEMEILQPLGDNPPAALKQIARPFSLSDIYIAVLKSRATIYTVMPGPHILGLPADKQMERIKEYEAARRQGAFEFLQKSISERASGGDEAARSGQRHTEKATGKKAKSLPLAKISQFDLERARAILLQQQSALAKLSIISGGWMDFLEEPSQASAIYSRIFLDFSRRYIIGYYPTNKEHDGKGRKIGMEVKGHPEYSILGRRAYYAPVPEQ
jgi:VWFA-related protein